jgi:predicted DNA-binding protein (UPF0251 family)
MSEIAPCMVTCGLKAFRLIDRESLSQESVAKRMQIFLKKLWRVIQTARKK